MKKLILSYLDTKFVNNFSIDVQRRTEGLDAFVFFVRYQNEEIGRIIKYNSDIKVKRNTYLVLSENFKNELKSWFDINLNYSSEIFFEWLKPKLEELKLKQYPF